MAEMISKTNTYLFGKKLVSIQYTLGMQVSIYTTLDRHLFS